VVAPDTGRVKVAERLAGHLKADLAIIHKMRSRHEAHKVEAREVVGEVEGRPCLVVDDMIDTGGTMVQGSQLLAEKGAGEIYIGATHGLFSGKAVQLIEEAPIKEVVVTNTVPIPEEKRIGKLTILSIAPIIADALRAVFEDTSVSEIFHGENQP
jgi:ribose-phosphate pyrophosphokinase